MQMTSFESISNIDNATLNIYKYYNLRRTLTSLRRAPSGPLRFINFANEILIREFGRQ